jgi:hypothetical protein
MTVAQMAEQIQTHVEEKIDGHHFTPFATLLYHLPSAIGQVFGNFSTNFFWSYHPGKGTLGVEIWWVKQDEFYSTARKHTKVFFNRTAYSYSQIVDLLEEAKLHSNPI